jgi:hypothetical protein
LLPTPPRGDAVTVGYQAGVGLPEEGLHLLEQIALASALGGDHTGRPVAADGSM